MAAAGWAAAEARSFSVLFLLLLCAVAGPAWGWGQHGESRGAGCVSVRSLVASCVSPVIMAAGRVLPVSGGLVWGGGGSEPVPGRLLGFGSL